jgi:hypothetical protein
VEEFVLVDVLIIFVRHKSSIYEAERKLNISEPIKEPVKIVADLTGFAGWWTSRAEVLRQ